MIFRYMLLMAVFHFNFISFSLFGDEFRVMPSLMSADVND